MSIREVYTPVVLGVDASAKLTGNQIGGFLAKTSGTITITNQKGVVIVNAVAVTAGVYTPMPFSLRGGAANATTGESTVTLAGGASGTLGY